MIFFVQVSNCDILDGKFFFPSEIALKTYFFNLPKKLVFKETVSMGRDPDGNRVFDTVEILKLEGVELRKWFEENIRIVKINENLLPDYERYFKGVKQ